MSIVSIKAHVECDGCGRPFEVDMDPASEFEENASLWDAACDAVRGSVLYSDNAPHGPSPNSSVQDGKHLCRFCTAQADQTAPSEDTER